MVNSTNVGFFGSGAGITLPYQFFGGPKNTVKINNIVVHNLFPRTTYDEAKNGVDKYLLVYFQNLHSTEQMNNVVAWLDHNTESLDDELKIGKAAVGKNGSETRVTDINTEPRNVSWFSCEEYSKGLVLGRHRPADYYGIWHWLHVRPNSKSKDGQHHAGLMITFDPPAGATTDGGTGGTPGGGTGSPPTNTPPATIADFNMASASDFGCGSEMRKTIANVRTNNPDWFLSSGDLSYANTGDCFISAMGDLITKFRFSPGNHDRAEGKPSSLMKQYQTATGIGDHNYFSMIHKNVYMLFIDQYTDYDVGSAQYQFIKKELEEKKNDNNIDWRIVFFHEPIYSADSKHDNLEDFRDIYHPIFDTNLVDVMQYSHNHNYQRSYPLRYNSNKPDVPTFTTTGNPDYTDPNGIITFCNAVAGRDLYSLNNQPTWNAYQNKGFGYSIWRFTLNGKKLQIDYFVNDGAALKDSVTITKT